MSTKPLWNAADVARVGESRRYGFRDAMRRREKALNDTDRWQRLLMLECRFCYYFSHGIAGQAFTAYWCKACGGECQHANTAVPDLCDECAVRLGACKRCGGTLTWDPLPISPKRGEKKGADR